MIQIFIIWVGLGLGLELELPNEQAVSSPCSDDDSRCTLAGLNEDPCTSLAQSKPIASSTADDRGPSCSSNPLSAL